MYYGTILVLVVFLLMLGTWFYTPKTGNKHPIVPPKPIKPHCCGDFTPKTYPGYPVYSEESRESYNKFAKDMAHYPTHVVFGSELAGDRYIDSVPSKSDVLSQYNFKVPESKVPFGSYEKIAY